MYLCASWCGVYVGTMWDELVCILVIQALEARQTPVVVDNTNTQLWEMRRYVVAVRFDLFLRLFCDFRHGFWVHRCLCWWVM